MVEASGPFKGLCPPDAYLVLAAPTSSFPELISRALIAVRLQKTSGTFGPLYIPLGCAKLK